MLAIATCAKCGLQARFRVTSEGIGLLEFDAVQFRADCLVSADSQSYECTELVACLKDAVIESSDEAA